MIKLIIFDYDGVIVDSFQNIYEVYRIICKKLEKKGFPETIDRFRELYGYNARELSRNLGVREDEFPKSDEIFAEEIVKKNPKLFKDIQEVIRELSKEYNLVLVSATTKSEVTQKLKNFGIYDCFSMVIASENKAPMNKVPAFKKVLEDFKMKPEEVAMIGDRNIDYDKGVEAGLLGRNIILVEYGWGYDKNKINGDICSYKVNSPKDIIKAIESLG